MKPQYNVQVLDVYLDSIHIAKLSLQDDKLYFEYDIAWQKNGYALSPHLPIDNNIPNLNVQRFLRNLLPEGEILEEILYQFHLSRNNTFGLMQSLG